MAAVANQVSVRRRSRLRDSLYAYIYVTPAVAAMVVASFVPIGFTIYVSLTNWSEYHPALVEGFHFVGLHNFSTIFQSLNGEILGVLIWTVAFASFTTAINFTVGLVFAFLLNNPDMPERNLYRTILILPWAVPGAIMTLSWTGLLDQNFGAVNVALSSIHLGPLQFGRIPWLTDPFWARVSLIMVNAWFGYPFMMTACLGALQSIPGELNDAAAVDGAGIWTRFRKITVPLLRSATLPLIISTFAFNLNNFGAVYLLTGGGPQNLGATAGATDILATYTYKLALNLQLYGLACAYSVMTFLFIGSFTLTQMKLSRAFQEVER
jgi:arabinogalactan oligomer/maltooligosaccharide transport system permease protein